MSLPYQKEIEDFINNKIFKVGDRIVLNEYTIHSLNDADGDYVDTCYLYKGYEGTIVSTNGYYGYAIFNENKRAGKVFFTENSVTLIKEVI